MQKTILTIVMALLCPILSSNAQSPDNNKSSQNQAITGKVISASGGEALPGAAIKITSTNQTILTDDKGEFTLNLANGKYNLNIYYLSYKAKDIQIEIPLKELLVIKLETEEQTLKEVEIVSTGYQKLPKERATGSFEVVDNKLFNRSAGTDVFSRLDGVTTGTLFLKSNSSLRKTPFDGLIIRGLSGLNGQKPPLIILDNFPYQGDPNSLNPNDVENITLLKDAAAASIWGTKAGNGVVVITTKKGRYNQPFQLGITSNLTISGKPDLKYLKAMSTSDYIDVEKMLFAKGFYNSSLNPKRPFKALSPVVELLAKQKEEGTDDAIVQAQIDALRRIDVRDDFLKYIYRKASKQQYAFNLNGGDQKINYLLSAGYDRNLDNLRTSNYSRKTLHLNNSIKLVKNLEFESGIFFTQSNDRLISSASPIEYGAVDLGSDQALYPYARLADESGNPLVIAKGLRSGYTDTVGKGALLDWKYRPLAEMDKSLNTINAFNVLINAGLKYTFSPNISADIKYQFEKSGSEQKDLYKKESYYTRDLINYYSQVKNGVLLSQAIPAGDVLSRFNNNTSSQTLRGQFNWSQSWNQKHHLNAIAGAEIREYLSSSNASRLYGYDDYNLSFQEVDLKNRYPLLTGGSRVIPGLGSTTLTGLTDRFVSFFANAAYSYTDRYTISLSARKDAANLFGLASNKKGLPLWSAGLSWNLSNEHFYKLEMLPLLKLRITYGYSGNIDNSVPASPTISYMAGRTPTNLPFAVNNNPPNSSLRWEKVGMLNLGLDFAFKNQKVNGSIEYYRKRSTDLLAYSPLDPSTGFRELVYNSAIIKGKGVDITLNAFPVKNQNINWSSTLLFSYNRPIVERYLLSLTNVKSYVANNGAVNPVEGSDIWGVYAFKFAGLDHDTGDPMGYVNGQESTDYNEILFNSKLADLKYYGSSKPLYYGAFRNTFGYKGFELSFNISYRFAYYFKRSGLDYQDLFQGGTGHTDFSQRWLNPGDEKTTNIPSMIYGHHNLNNREQFYTYSSALVEKGDNIRLEDINLGYTFNRPDRSLKKIRVYLNANNMGILWRANKLGIDSDYGYASNLIPPSRTIVCGVSVNF